MRDQEVSDKEIQNLKLFDLLKHTGKAKATLYMCDFIVMNTNLS